MKLIEVYVLCFYGCFLCFYLQVHVFNIYGSYVHADSINRFYQPGTSISRSENNYLSCHSVPFQPSLVFWLAVWLSGNALVSINEATLRRTRLVLEWITVSGVQLPVQENLSQYITSHPGQLSLAIPPWVGTVSNSQRAVMLCRWGVKAGMGGRWNCVIPLLSRAISERFSYGLILY